MPALLIIGRILFGGFFIYSGFNHLVNTNMLAGYAKSKKVPWPIVAVIISGLVILFGGLGVLLWLYVRLALTFIIIFLLLVSLTMHNFWAETETEGKMGDMVNFTKNMALIGAALMMMSL